LSNIKAVADGRCTLFSMKTAKGKVRKRKRLPDYRHVLLGMTLEEIERMDAATRKVIRELKAKGRLRVPT
jgi:hypothetical protein